MAALTTQYDTYNRSWPDVFVGEYAANNGDQQTLQAGLAEAAFILGFEANADKVGKRRRGVLCCPDFYFFFIWFPNLLRFIPTLHSPTRNPDTDSNVSNNPPSLCA